jgi:hypothetical protein
MAVVGRMRGAKPKTATMATPARRSAEVEIFLLFSGRANEEDGAQHGGCVEASSGDDRRWCHEHERCDEGLLG